MKRSLFIAAALSILGLTTGASAFAQMAVTSHVGTLKAGVEYESLTAPHKTAVPKGKVEVLEFFWYGCPHCYALEPFINAWRKSLPSYVEFERVPIEWQAFHLAHAQLFYTLKALGRSDLDQKAFDSIHEQKNPLAGRTADETLARQLQFATENGIDAVTFRTAYNSAGVQEALKHANDLMNEYQVVGVPEIVVNGKYVTGLDKSGGDEQKLITIMNQLVASEHH